LVYRPARSTELAGAFDMKLRIGFVLLILFWCSIGLCQESLEPCESVQALNSFQRILAVRVLENLNLERSPAESGRWPVARLIVEPTWQPESAVTVYLPDRGTAIVEAVVASKNISNSNIEMIPVPNEEKPTFRSAPAKDKRKVGMTSFRRAISRELASEISAIFVQNIRSAKEPSEEDARIVLDGTGYRFLAWIHDQGFICGSVYPPDDGTLSAELVSLGETLFQYAKSEQPKSAAKAEQLRKQITNLKHKNSS
jgi:hypothetical protein